MTDACALRESLAAGDLSVREAVEDTLARIAARDGELQSLTSVLADTALERAERLDANEDRGPLFGLPFVLKANMCLEGIEAHCGSRVLAGWRAPYTATFVRRALDAGAVVIGVSEMDEFAMGSSGENSAYRIARNPWDTERAPGGSSSGSAAAVAGGLVPLALGSDTGGSVRQPASFCGVSGFKPTYGRVSRYGLVAFGSSLDQVAPLARSVRDLELLFGAIAGEDDRDATTLAEPAPRPETTSDLAGLRIGVPDELFPDALDADVRARVEGALSDLEGLGAELVPVALPRVPYALPTYYVLATAEASSNLARFDGVRYGAREEGDGSLFGMMSATRTAGFGPEVERRILLGTFGLSRGYQDAWYARANRVRAALARDFERVFETVDLVAGPTSPTPAFRLGERAADPLAMYAADLLTVPASLAGLPALSVPCGLVERDETELPVGLQVIGPRRADARVLLAGRLYQGATRHHEHEPRAFEAGGAE